VSNFHAIFPALIKKFSFSFRYFWLSKQASGMEFQDLANDFLPLLINKNKNVHAMGEMTK
jgi:hypothetical protein